MKEKTRRILITLLFALFIGSSTFVTLGMGHFASVGTTMVYAAPANIVYYPPTVTVSVSTVMTTGMLPSQPISITVIPNCGNSATGCNPPNGSLQVSIVSVFSKNLTENGDANVLTTFASTPFSVPKVFSYSWAVPHLDNQQVVISATAINGQPAVGVSPLVVVTVDTVAPKTGIPQPIQTPWITDAAAIYTWTAASDGAGIASYQINITNTQTYTDIFATTQTSFTFTQFSTEGVGYYARLRAVDIFGNIGDWSAFSPVVILDVSAPTVVVTAPVTHASKEPFSVQWQSEDRHSGIKDVILSYSGPGTISGTYVFSTSASGLFTLAKSEMDYGTYTFTVKANNNAGKSNSVTKNIEVIPVVVYLPLVLKNYPPQWTRGNGTAGVNFHGASYCGNGTNQVWYAGTAQAGVWKSSDNGANWSKLVDVSPYPYPVIANPNTAECNEAFVAVWGQGVNKIVETTVTPVNTGLGDTYLYGLAISGSIFYAGTNSAGVFRTDVNTINWQPANNGIVDMRIRSLNVAGSNIYAGARNCKLYISNNKGNSWVEKTVLASGCNDAQVWSVAQVGSLLFAGLGGNLGLYVSQNSGMSWSRVNSVPANTIYGIAYDDVHEKLYVSAYGAGVYRCSVSGGTTQCAAYNNGLTAMNTRELTINNGQVVVSTGDGVWRVEALR